MTQLHPHPEAALTSQCLAGKRHETVKEGEGTGEYKLQAIPGDG